MTNYQLSGKGRLVLLLHGWGDSAKGLQAISGQLAKSNQVLAVDLPGFGATQAPEEVWDLDNYAKFLNSLLAKLTLSQPYAVIGHSNGGAVAIRAISLGNLQPKKLVLIAASGVREGGKFRRLFLNIIAKTGNVATIWMPERYRRDLRKSLYSTAGSDMLVAPHLEETFKKTVRQDVQADAAGINIPTLLIYGGADEAVPVADGQQYHGLISGSRLEIIKDSGHFIQNDSPDKLNTLIEDFLK